MPLKSIHNLIHARDGEVWSVSPDDSVYDAVKLLVEKNIGALLVVRQGKPVGVVPWCFCGENSPADMGNAPLHGRR